MLLISPPTYIAAVLFLGLMGFLYWAILRGMVNYARREPADRAVPQHFLDSGILRRAAPHHAQHRGRAHHGHTGHSDDDAHLARGRDPQ